MTARGLNANSIEQDMGTENAGKAPSRTLVSKVAELATRYNVRTDRLSPAIGWS